MFIPKTIWNYSLETEAERLVFTAFGITSGFYQENGFLVLPFKHKQESTVFFPRLELNTSFWKKVKKLKLNFNPKAPDLIAEVKTKLNEEDFNLKENDKDKLKNLWHSKEKIFWRILHNFLPDFFDNIKEVEIRPTEFGTLSSFNRFNTDERKIFVSIRMDRDVSYIAEAIISSLLTKSLIEDNLRWREREAISDFLMVETIYKKIFPNYRKTLRFVESKDLGNLNTLSLRYINELGFCSKNLFSLKEGVQLKGINISRKLSKTEKKLLHLFIKNKNQLCSYDQLGEVVWGKEYFENFSPWALAKIIERLRKKLKQFDLDPSRIIQAIRKEGYLLID